MAKTYDVDNKLPNMIEAGTKITGNIHTTGDIKIDGEVEGNIMSEGKIIIGSKGVINGEIECLNAEVSGNVIGRILVKELLTLKQSAVILGDIMTKTLMIEPNAEFSGKCQMGNSQNTPNSTTPEIPNAEKPSK